MQIEELMLFWSVPDITGDDASFAKPGMKFLGRNTVLIEENEMELYC